MKWKQFDSYHFERSEFACKCGCGRDTIDHETLYLCEVVRRFCDEPVTVNSGFRCRQHNKEVGGRPNSQHLYGRAADLRVSDPVKVFNYLCEKYPNQYGFGLYSTFVHVDTRTGKAKRWIKK